MFNLVRHIFNANFLLYNNTFHIHISTKVEGVVFVIVPVCLLYTVHKIYIPGNSQMLMNLLIQNLSTENHLTMKYYFFK